MGSMNITIAIIKPEDKGWFVKCGDRYCDELCWDEMLGTVARLTLNGAGAPNYLKTKEEWKQYWAAFGIGERQSLSETERLLTEGTPNA
jgi:hypothetical protein